MNVDFSGLYKDKSNVELLKVIFKGKDYQPEVVKIVETILATRNVTNDERRAAGFIIEEPVVQTEKTTYISHGNPDVDLLDSFNNVSGRIKTRFRGFLLLLSLYYLREFYYSLRSFLWILNSDGQFTLLNDVLISISLILMPFAVYKLYKKKPVGWYLVFGENVIGLVIRSVLASNMLQFYLIYAPSRIWSLAPALILSVVVIIFLWQKRITVDLGITETLKRRTVLVCGIILALVFGIWYLMRSNVAV